MSPRGRARIYCSGRAEGLGCNNRGTFLDTYEAQIEWYLDHFIIPEEYQDKMLEIHRRQESTSEDIKKQREALHNALRRLKDQYKWGHISKREYFADYQTTQYELEKITSYNDDHETIERLANFLNNIVDAWRVATQEQRNKMARSLFDRIVIEDNRVVFVKPKPELEQFFRMNFECHTSDIAGDPEGI